MHNYRFYFFLLFLFSLSSCATSPLSEQKSNLYWQIGSDHLEQRNYPEALLNLRKGEELSPNNIRILNSLGVLYLEKGLTKVSVEYFQRALKTDPSFSDARNNLASAYVALGQYKPALGELKIVLEDLTYPHQEKPLTNMGIIYLRKNNLKKAKSFFQRSLRANSNYCLGYSYYGQTLMKQKDFESSSRIFDQALKVCQTMLDELNYLGALSNYHLGKIEYAKFLLNDAIKINPIGEYAEKARVLIGTLEQEKK